MPERMLKVLSLGVFGSLLAALIANSSPAQEPLPPVPTQPDPEPLPLPLPPAQPAKPAPPIGTRDLSPAKPGFTAAPVEGDGMEVLAKGPVHEAFATTAEAPAAPPVVEKQPPEPIEELPPEQKPEGDNVQWIPGYWHWDDDAEKFIWISGFWRQPPPGRVWVPGSWRKVEGGFQWVGGFWQEVNPLPQPNPPQPVQPEIEYLPEPPQNLEIGPSVEAPGENYFYAPGSWVWRGRYVWRPGVWAEYRPNWVWVPARYHWTPAGYVFCDGHWDYEPSQRGVLFAPVAFAQPIYTQPAFVYTPAYVVSEPCFFGALFVRRGWGCYYFGDYFANRYAFRGYSAWCGVYGRNGFNTGFGVGRRWGYDPLWSYYSQAYRNKPAWNRGVGDLYNGRYSGKLARPPVTLVQQNTVINNIANVNTRNVTNNITVVNGTPSVNNKDVTNVAMLAPLKAAPDLQKTKFQTVSAENRRSEAAAAKQIREVAAQRTKLETAVVNQQPLRPQSDPGAQPTTKVQPKSIKLDVPKAAVARAQVNDEKKAPPPNPIQRKNNTGAKFDPKPQNPTPKVDLPKVEPKLNPQPKVEPRPLPKADVPKSNPQPVNPSPKVDTQPKTNLLPKVDVPKADPQPKASPRPLPKADVPKVDPQPKVNPAPKVDLPKNNPQPKVNPAPKVDLPKNNLQPKVNPAPTPPQVKSNPVPPSVTPRVNPAPPTPQPKVTPTPMTPRVNPVPPTSQPKVSPPSVPSQPRVNPSPTVTAKPAVVNPPKVNTPPRVSQPSNVQPRANPAPAGKPPTKSRR